MIFLPCCQKTNVQTFGIQEVKRRLMFFYGFFSTKDSGSSSKKSSSYVSSAIYMFFFLWSLEWKTDACVFSFPISCSLLGFFVATLQFVLGLWFKFLRMYPSCSLGCACLHNPVYFGLMVWKLWYTSFGLKETKGCSKEKGSQYFKFRLLNGVLFLIYSLIILLAWFVIIGRHL